MMSDVTSRAKHRQQKAGDKQEYSQQSTDPVITGRRKTEPRNTRHTIRRTEWEDEQMKHWTETWEDRETRHEDKLQNKTGNIKTKNTKPAHSFTANKGNKRENNELLQKCFVDLTSLKCFFKREESFSELSLRNMRLVPCKPERSLTSAAGSSTFGSIVT